MKRTIFALIVIACIITIGILEQLYLNKTFDEIKGQALEIQQLINSDPEEAHEKALLLKDDWNRRKHLTEAIVSHNETREMTLRVAELEGYTKALDNKSSEATVNMLIEMCDNYMHILGFSWDTILMPAPRGRPYSTITSLNAASLQLQHPAPF